MVNSKHPSKTHIYSVLLIVLVIAVTLALWLLFLYDISHIILVRKYNKSTLWLRVRMRMRMRVESVRRQVVMMAQHRLCAKTKQNTGEVSETEQEMERMGERKRNIVFFPMLSQPFTGILITLGHYIKCTNFSSFLW